MWGTLDMMSLTGKASTVDVLHTVVGDQELLLPAHEDRPSVERVGHRHLRLLELVPDVAEGREPRPVHHVLLLGRAPIARQEPVPTPNDLGVEVRRELGPVVGEAADAQVPAEVRGGKVDVLFI